MNSYEDKVLYRHLSEAEHGSDFDGYLMTFACSIFILIIPSFVLFIITFIFIFRLGYFNPYQDIYGSMFFAMPFVGIVTAALFSRYPKNTVMPGPVYIHGIGAAVKVTVFVTFGILILYGYIVIRLSVMGDNWNATMTGIEHFWLFIKIVGVPVIFLAVPIIMWIIRIMYQYHPLRPKSKQKRKNSM